MNYSSDAFERTVHWAKTQGVEIVSTTEAEERWGKCQRTDGYHPYYANPRESFFLNEAYERCKKLGKTIAVVEDLS